MSDLRDLTDDELDATRLEIINEIERRANLAAIPEQINDLKSKYLEAGGDPAELDKENTNE